MPTPSLGDLLKQGSAELNKLRKADKLPQDFTGATLVRLFCASANLEGLDLTGSEWERCELSKIVFRDADLSNAYFHGGRLEDCDFSGANLEGASFEKLKLLRCDFTGARGIGEIELTDVVMHDVIGLDEPDDDEEGSTEDASDAVVCLRDRLPKGFRRLPIEAIIEEAAKHLKITTGTPGKEADVRALEEALGVPFPADYRAFLMRFGNMEVLGDVDYAFGHFKVFGIGDIEAARQEYLDEFKEWGFTPEMLDARSSDEITPGTSGSLGQRRAKLKEALNVADVHVKRFFGDKHDAMRVAYQFMVPVMATPDEFHHAVDCVGPDTQMYTVSIKTLEIEPPSGTFTARLLQCLESVVLVVPEAPETSDTPES